MSEDDVLFGYRLLGTTDLGRFFVRLQSGLARSIDLGAVDLLAPTFLFVGSPSSCLAHSSVWSDHHGYIARQQIWS